MLTIRWYGIPATYHNMFTVLDLIMGLGSIDRRIVLQFVRLTTGHAILAKGQQPMMNVISYSKATKIKILTSL